MNNFLKLPLFDLFNFRGLIYQLVKREVLGRYKGSWLGLAWSFLTPLLMLTVYTFVFSAVFHTKWGDSGEGRLHFALMLFAGMMIFMPFAEVAGRAPSLMLHHASYVKKVVFPLEILPPVAVCVALFHGLVGLGILLICAGFQSSLGWPLLALPLIVIPYALMMVGFAWILSALGVYLRDIGQAMGLLLTALQFLSPVFYPLGAVPVRFQMFMNFSPLTIPIESIRAILLKGIWPDWGGLATYTLGAALLAACGYAFFIRVRDGFADVL